MEKPLYKAGRKFFKVKAKNIYWPSVSGNSMNAVDHPFGSGYSGIGKHKTVARNAPPGKKVGSIAASRTGKRKGKRR